MKQPPAYVAQRNSQVYHLAKAIYGLKQSPQAWFEKFSNIVIGYEFQRYIVDHSVFIKNLADGCVLLAVYMDDIILTGSNSAAISKTGVSKEAFYYQRYGQT